MEGRAIHGITVPSVAEEVNVPPTVKILKPKEKFIKIVERKARETGDYDVLSRADIEVLALALEKNSKIATNDFALQNVARSLNLEIIPLGKEIKKEIKWEWYCPACRRSYKRKGICEFCGTELKRRPKFQRIIRKGPDL